MTTTFPNSQFFYPTKYGKEIITTDLTNHTILLPTISIGNVPQLAVDVLLHQQPGFKLFGYYHDPFALESFITTTTTSGAQQTLTMNIELYISTDTKTILVQQKAGLLPHRHQSFFKEFFTFLHNMAPKQIVLLTSISNQYRHDAELQSSLQQTRAGGVNTKHCIQFFCVENQLPYHPQDEMTNEVPEKIEPHATFTPPTPPAAALGLPLATAVKEACPELTFTTYDQQFVDDVKQYKRIKAQKQQQYDLLYADGVDNKKEKTKKEKNDDKEEGGSKTPKKDYIYFPFPVKGGGLTFKLAKYARTHDIPLIAFVSLNAKGDTRDCAIKLLEQVAQYLAKTTSNAEKFTAIAAGVRDKTIKTPEVWKVLFEGH